MSTKGSRTREAVTSSEQELRLLVEAIPALVWRAGPEGNIEYVNKRVLDYLGAPLSEVIGWGWMDKVHPDDVAFKVRTWLQNLESGKPHDVMCRFHGADGGYRWFEVRGAPLRASDGSVLSWCGVLIDIDDRREAEEALRESEDKLRQVIETVPSLLWSLGPHGEQTQLNQRALDYIGVRYEDLLRLGWTAFLHPDDLSETVNAFSHAMETGTSFQAVHRLRRADGEYCWHHARGEPLRDEQGRVIQWYGLTVDIDEGKRAEDRLRRSEAYLAEAQRLSHTGSFGWTPSSGELHWSEETFRILEYDPSIKPSIERVLERIHPDDLAMVRQILDETSRGTEIDTTHRLLLPDGSIKFVHVLGHALKDANGNLEIVGAVMDVTENTCLYRDLTEREAKVRRLVDANIIGVFIGDLNGRILEANDAFLQIVGYDCEDVTAGRINWKDLSPQDWRERDAQWIEEKERTRVRLPIEEEYLRKDGSRVPVLVGSAKFEGANQGVAFVLDLTERKKAEEQLRLSEARLAEAQRLSHSGVAAYNETTILYGSEETYRIWGFDPAQGVPSREAVNQRIHPDDRDRVLAEVQRAVCERRDYSIGYRIVLPDGTAKHLESLGRPVFSASGELVEIVVTHLDVTERKGAEQASRESEYKLRQIIEAVPGLIWSAGSDGETTYANQRLQDYTGPRLEDFKNRIWERFLHPDDLPETARAFDQAVHMGTSYDVVHRLRRSDGEYRWHHNRAEPLRDHEGRIIQWYGLSVDIDEGKKAEDRLRRSEAHLAEAQRLSRTGSSVYSDTAILYWSEEAFRIWGFDPAQGLPTREEMLQRIHPDDRDRHHQETKDALREKRDCSIEFRIVLGDGTVKDVAKIYHPVFSTSGELVEIVASGIDVTERKRAEEELERLRQLELDLAHMNRLSVMGELAASLAHEVTQPIAAARNNARAALNFLDQRPVDMGEVREALGCVVGDADRAGIIVDRIRDHVKKAPPRKDRFDLNEAIHEVLILARSVIAKNGVSVQTRLTERLAPIEGDRVQLQQVMLNLVLNAAEAMSAVDKGARDLWISSDHARANDVRVVVRDSGPGIDPEHVESVFDAFYTTKSNGMGMGLSICRSIIEAHGGRLWADANDPRGAAFQFTLPHAQRSS